MTLYRNRPEGFRDFRNALLLRSLPVSILAIGVGIGMSVYNSSHSPGQEAETLPIIILVMVGALAAGYQRIITRHKKLYESYTLTIAEDQITREQDNTPTITLPVTDITSITRNQNGSFTIKGSSALNVIGVYKQIAEYDALDNQLNQIHPVSVQATKPIAEKLRYPTYLLMLGLMIIVFVASNKLLVGVSGVAITGLMIWGFIFIQRGPNIDHDTKRRRWSILLVLLLIIATTILKLIE